MQQFLSPFKLHKSLKPNSKFLEKTEILITLLVLVRAASSPWKCTASSHSVRAGGPGHISSQRLRHLKDLKELSEGIGLDSLHPRPYAYWNFNYLTIKLTAAVWLIYRFLLCQKAEILEPTTDSIVSSLRKTRLLKTTENWDGFLPGAQSQKSRFQAAWELSAVPNQV